MYNQGVKSNTHPETPTLFNSTVSGSNRCDKLNIGETSSNSPIVGTSNIEKIIIVYCDQTFEEIHPKR
jgi:hypothetical protein